MKKKSGLGRGLDALLGDALLASTAESLASSVMTELPLEQIQPGKFQPRTHFDLDKLKELAASIKAQGLVQPVVVRKIGGWVAAARHYLAPPPAGGASTVYICPKNVSYLRPNLTASTDFWVVRFVDGSELRVIAPWPEGL